MLSVLVFALMLSLCKIRNHEPYIGFQTHFENFTSLDNLEV